MYTTQTKTQENSTLLLWAHVLGNPTVGARDLVVRVEVRVSRATLGGGDAFNL